VSHSTTTDGQDLSISGAERVDRVCERFEAAWRQRPALENYLGDVPEAERPALLRELILLDMEYRRRLGDEPRPEEYARRFGLMVAEPPPPAVPPAGVRYQVRGEIGRGGVGVVHHGYDPDLGRDLAIKVLQERGQADPEQVRRFVAEARIAGQLQHPGVVPVYELGSFADGRPYFTMKLVQGQTLAALLGARAEPGQDLPRFLGIFQQLCQAVGFAHSRGIIHRDLKPSNVMVGSFGEVQVMDWGLAKVLQSGSPLCGGTLQQDRHGVAGYSDAHHSPEHTQVGALLGTLPYMPPEQARGEVGRLDRRCDVFALGAVLCEVLTGHPPYVAATSAELLRLAEQGELASAWDRLGGCGADPELVALTRRCLAADPAERPANAGEVARAVTAHLEGVQQRLRQTEVERAAALARAEEASAKAEAERRARRLLVGLAGAVLALILVAVGLVLVARERAYLANTQRWYLRSKSNLELLFEMIIDGELSAQPDALPLLKDVLEHYGELIEEREADRLPGREELAEDWERLAGFYKIVGDKRRALDALSRAEALFAQPGDRTRVQLARAWLIQELGERGAERPLPPGARVDVTEVRDRAPNDPDRLRGWARELHYRGMLEQANERLPRALGFYQEALRAWEDLAANHTLSLDDLAAQARAHGYLGDLQLSLGQPQAARRSYAEAMKLRRKVFNARPRNADANFQLNRSFYNEGHYYRSTGRRALARQAFQEALARQEKLARQRRVVADYQADLAWTCVELAECELEDGQPEQARPRLLTAVAIYEALTKDDPSFSIRLACCQVNLARCDRVSDPARARAALASARKLLSRRAPQQLQSNELFYLALACALSAELASPGTAENARAAGEAVRLLRRVVQRGGLVAARVKAEPAFRRALGGQPGFPAVLD
jgi:serine/threonine protein kinase